ncbi:MAG: DUF3298 domain-containing protein [Butyrivibrio sp.]|nr:DUF3298 domain-containing protein [Butyrivibrio sp.]
MRNSLFRRIAGIGLTAFVVLGTASCGGASPRNTETTQNAVRNDEGNTNPEDKEDDQGSKPDNGQIDKEAKENEDSPDNSSDKEFEPIRQSFSDEKEILRYLAGDWSYIYPKSDSVYASLSISEDGTVTLVRDYDNASCSGKLSFKKNNSDAQGPDGFSLKLNNIEKFIPGNENVPNGLSAISSGDFYIGTGKGSDCLYLEEVGNGDTWISMHVLNPYYNENDMNPQIKWLFTRKNDRADELQPAKNRKFYGFAWRSEGDGLYFQDMTPLESEEYEDYSDRHFLGARFRMSNDVGVRFYSYDSSLDLSRLVHEQTIYDEYPFEMYSVETDENGRIISLTEVERALYDIYDMKDLDPEFSVSDDGRVFKYNNCTFKLEDFGCAATAIMDCVKVGNWIILDCHVNPHIGQYLFFNTISGWVELTIEGSNLVWKGDDLSTAVYSNYDGIYDIWGNYIASVPEGEIFDLSLDGDYVEAQYSVFENNKDKELTGRFEFENVDKEMFAYFEYLVSRRNREWNSFIEMAPENAAAFIMVNPPACISNHIPYIRTYKEGALDKVAVISLKDREKIYLGPLGMQDYADGGEFYVTEKTDISAFAVTVPEGMPVDNLVIRTSAGRDELVWDVFQISGRTPQRSVFLTSDTTDDAASAKPSSEYDLDGGIPFSYKSHPYSYVEDDEEFALGNYYTIEINDLVKRNYPALVKALDRFSDKSEEYLLNFFKENQSEIREMFKDGARLSYESDQYFDPVRADGRVFSFEIQDYTYLAGAHGFGGFVGYNFDPQTGKEISFSEVLKTVDGLPNIIVNELETQNEDLSEYFKNCPGDRERLLKDIPRRLEDNARYLQWTIDYDGIWVYFEDYAMGSYAVGMQKVKLKFDDYPEIFTDTYNNYKSSSVPAIRGIATEAKDAPVTRIVSADPANLWDTSESDDGN